MNFASLILTGALLWIGFAEAARADEESKKRSPRQELIEDLSPSELKVIESNKDRIVAVYQGLRK